MVASKSAALFCHQNWVDTNNEWEGNLDVDSSSAEYVKRGLLFLDSRDWAIVLPHGR